MRGSNFGLPWSDFEKEILKNNYKNITKIELMDLLPGRSWRTIQERARILNVNGFSNNGKNKHLLTDKYCIVYLEKRNGETIECYVSPSDINKVLNMGKWRADFKTKRNIYYARCNIFVDGIKKSIYMHRFLLDFPNGLEVDHIDGNTLNNTLGNLRITTKSENMQNTSKETHSKCGIKNVYWHNQLGYWVAKIMVDKKPIIRYCKSKEEARIAVDELRAVHMSSHNNRWK